MWGQAPPLIGELLPTSQTARCRYESSQDSASASVTAPALVVPAPVPTATVPETPALSTIPALTAPAVAQSVQPTAGLTPFLAPVTVPPAPAAAQTPFLAPVSAPMAPTTAPHTASTAVAAPAADVQAMLAAAMQAGFAAGQKRAREDDGTQTERDVRQRFDVPDAPAAPNSIPDAPTRRGAPATRDPATEFRFGPVRWAAPPSTAFIRQSRDVIAEGMRTRPNMREFRVRRVPDDRDPDYLIGSFDTPAATAAFIQAWMSERSGKWAHVASPNI
ncbi:hypothetical protein B0H13DRAFT_1853340 [Mycena leptocephala]|nr:hypothetical protein B0H13DRAFT_1853340 [Mycena leptocephala]